MRACAARTSILLTLGLAALGPSPASAQDAALAEALAFAPADSAFIYATD